MPKTHSNQKDKGQLDDFLNHEEFQKIGSKKYVPKKYPKIPDLNLALILTSHAFCLAAF